MPRQSAILALFTQIWLATVTCGPLTAQILILEDGAIERLSSAATQLDVENIPSPDKVKKELAEAVTELESFVDLDSENGKRWSRFLKLPELKAALEKPAIPPTLLYNLHANMRQNYEGLGYPQYVRVRDGIDQLASAMRFGRNPEGAVKYLASEINKTTNQLKDDSADEWTRLNSLYSLLGLLDQARQTPEALTALKEQFSAPNLQFHITEQMVNRLGILPVQEPQDVNECILGTRIRGDACLTGSVTYDFLPHSSGANVDINLVGNMTTNNRGFNRGVILRTTGRSPINARKLITVTPQSITAGETRVAVALSTRINAIQHRSAIVRRIAKRKASEQKPLADSIAQGRLKKKMVTQYDARVAEQLAQAQTQYVKFQQEAKNRPEYRRLGFPAPKVQFHSTDHLIEASLRQAVDYQLAAPGPCPFPRLADGGSVEIHQSVINNALDRLLGGRRIKNSDLDDYALQIADKVPEEIQKQVDGAYWEAALTRYFPIVVGLDNGQLTLEIRLLELTGQDLRLRGMKVRVTYDVELRDQRLILDRVGEIEITGGTTVQRGALRGKLKPNFEEHIETEPLLVSSLFPNAKPQAKEVLGKIVVQDVRIDDGWMQITVR